MDTIFAQSSAPGKAGVAVFRISGPSALAALKKLSAEKNFSPTPNRIYPRKIYDPASGEPIDKALVVYFKSPASFTGEDSVEIHTHGSIAVTKKLYSVLGSLESFRVAERGEFAKRAFLNGKIDLTAAEGLADLIDSETEAQRRQALRQADGALEKLYASWREKLLKNLAYLEAYIDFPDEDLPESLSDEISSGIGDLKKAMEAHINDGGKGRALRDGLKLAIVGPPNAGKSSLLNFLCSREASIVSDIEGTTRDVVESKIDFRGYPLIIQDSAGLRETTFDPIEKEGIKRALKIAEEADIKIILFDPSSAPSLSEKEIFKNLTDENTLPAVNKRDLTENPVIFSVRGRAALNISLKANSGLDEFLNELEKIVEKIAGYSESPLITRERHRDSVKKALEALSSFDLKGDVVLAAEDLRIASRALSGLIGTLAVEEILGEIFGNFCIGK